eukprot:1546002-Rhodomonas_salina.1
MSAATTVAPHADHARPPAASPVTAKPARGVASKATAEFVPMVPPITPRETPPAYRKRSPSPGAAHRTAAPAGGLAPFNINGQA